jgi:hypothetical protein
MKKHTKNCANTACGKEFHPYTTIDKYCSAPCFLLCFKEKPKKEQKAIPKVSKKKTIEILRYSVLRQEFLGKPENQICPVTGNQTTDVHHKKGRVGELFLDTSFWIALSRQGHQYVEEHPEWAKEKGYSLSRL